MPQANGITLTFIEKSGLIQAAENLGLLSKISDRYAMLGRVVMHLSWKSKLHMPASSLPSLVAHGQRSTCIRRGRRSYHLDFALRKPVC